MSKGRSTDVVIVGGAAAGAAIAHKLAEQGKRVVLFCRTDVPGATDSNQKWLHSGLLYPSGTLAARAWSNRLQDWGIKRPYVVGPDNACILALKSATIRERVKMWGQWKADGLTIPEAQPLGPDDRKRLRSLGLRFKDGWVTPDCAIDFPALVRDMRLNLVGQLRKNSHLPQPKTRGRVIEGARVLRLSRGRDGISGVVYEWTGEQRSLSCNQCIVAAGAWSLELLKDIEVPLPLIRKKCAVVVFRRKQLNVDKITVWLDVTKEDGTIGDFTLVPFKTQTLAAGPDFKVVYQLPQGRKLEHLKVGRSEVETVGGELRQCISASLAKRLKPSDGSARVCFKTEQYNPSHPDVDIKVYTQNAGIGDRGHGVRGLTVALPGKASLMFDLAREVSKCVP